MTSQSTSPKFSPEVRERAVRMVREHSAQHTSQWAAIVSIAAKIGCTAQTLSNWIKQAERDAGIHRRGPWRTLEAVEYATLDWVDWFNYRRLLSSVGNVPPAEAEAAYYASLEEPAKIAA